MFSSAEAVTAATRVAAGLFTRHVWKYIILLFILANLKTLPLMWHLRFFNGFWGHRPPFGLFRRRMLRAGRIGPSALFRPAIITSHTPLMECDLFGHKSNSTYFSDLDMSRLHLVMLVFFDAADHVRPDNNRSLNTTTTTTSPPPVGKPGIHLGGVSCIFRREIKPYKEYDVLTRVLSWDEKWIYVVSHIVKKGAVKPKRYLLQPNGPSKGWWPFSLLRRRREGVKKPTKPSKDQPNGAATTSSTTPTAAVDSAIYASSIAKYVVKRGRVTIPPERVLQAAGLLPPRPDAVPLPLPDSSDDPITIQKDQTSQEINEEEGEKISNNIDITQEEENEEAILNATLLPKGDNHGDEDHENEDDNGDDKWDWSRIETERKRGLHLAGLIKGMDNLHDAIRGDNGIVLGHYSDVF
ncbi:MAG: hypothetical protein M1823_003748 [Watsoniomyces obsoletus]|nr:MAG: hypothetical protein M1823_003748 [Watsoniomyces obsoletus]